MSKSCGDAECVCAGKSADEISRMFKRGGVAEKALFLASKVPVTVDTVGEDINQAVILINQVQTGMAEIGAGATGKKVEAALSVARPVRERPGGGGRWRRLEGHREGRRRRAGARLHHRLRGGLGGRLRGRLGGRLRGRLGGRLRGRLGGRRHGRLCGRLGGRVGDAEAGSRAY